MPPVAFPPEPKGAYVGAKESLNGDVFAKIAQDGARTVPGREHGGNCDVSYIHRIHFVRDLKRENDGQIKNLSKGSRCYFPVFVEGANLSVGDLHFSQGDVGVKIFS